MPTDKERFQQLNDAVRRSTSDAAGMLYRVGEALAEIERRKLYQSAGYATFADYLIHGTDLSRSSAYRLKQLAGAFSEQAVIDHGQGTLLAAVAYLNAIDAPANDDALATPIVVPRPDRDVHQTLGDSSESDIRAALRALSDDGDEAPEPPPPPEVPEHIERAVAKAAGRPPGDVVGIRIADDGRFLLSFKDVPLHRMRPFLATLLRLQMEAGVRASGVRPSGVRSTGASPRNPGATDA